MNDFDALPLATGPSIDLNKVNAFVSSICVTALPERAIRKKIYYLKGCFFGPVDGGNWICLLFLVIVKTVVCYLVLLMASSFLNMYLVNSFNCTVSLYIINIHSLS